MTENPLKDVALADLEQEMATTRRVLERVPDEHLAWTPHEKSMSLAQLASHIADVAGLQIGIARADELDFLNGPPRPGPAASREELLARFDANSAALREAIAGLDDEALARPWTLRRGERVVFNVPRALALRTLGISHTAHHRGQLTVYLRLLGVPLPSVYGPTADEAF